MYIEDEDLDQPDLAPPAASRIQTLKDLNGRTLTIGDKLTLIDDSWRILFPEYRSVGQCIVTLLVSDVLPDQQYRLGISDIVPVQGRINVPAGITAVRGLVEIQKAMALSDSLRDDTPDIEGRRQTGFRVDYEELKAQFKHGNKATLEFPEHVPASHVRSSVQTTLRRHGIYTTTEVKGNILVLTRLKAPVRAKPNPEKPGNI